ncbi:MAG: NHLP bacteriocin system secretion protein, partial [Treponema sp.]|nr:NHLP bacteriocin system secretion protein [Treponema sp.]
VSKERRMRELFEQGLITENEYVSSKQNSLDIDRQVNEKRHELAVLNENYQKSTRILSPTTGIVLEMSVEKNDYVNPGTTIALIGKDGTSPTEAILFIAANEGKKIKQGMKIGVIPSTVKREEYGYIQGIVTEVSEYPVTEAYMNTVLKNSMLTRTFTQIQNPIEVRASIIPDPNTVSGYKWSSSKGPDEKMSSGILCSSTVTVEEKRPIELVIPMFKKKILGIGSDDTYEAQQQAPLQQPPVQ